MNKKILVLLIPLLFTHLFMYAQFKKGMRMAGATIGSLFFNSGTSEVSYPSPATGYTSRITSYGVNLTPSLGWFITDNTAVGISLLINPSSNKATYESGGTTYQEDKVNTFNIGLGGFLRSYLGTSSFMPFVQGSLNIGISSQNSSGFFYGGSGPGVYKLTYDGKSSGGVFTNGTLALGLTKLLNPHTGLDIYAGYTYSYSQNDMKTTTNRDDGIDGSIDLVSVSEPSTKFTNHGFMIGIGFQVFLEPRK